MKSAKAAKKPKAEKVPRLRGAPPLPPPPDRPAVDVGSIPTLRDLVAHLWGVARDALDFPSHPLEKISARKILAEGSGYINRFRSLGPGGARPLPDAELDEIASDAPKQLAAGQQTIDVTPREASEPVPVPQPTERP